LPALFVARRLAWPGFPSSRKGPARRGPSFCEEPAPADAVGADVPVQSVPRFMRFWIRSSTT